MIAMQYSFTLPADYDMDIIGRRIRDKGPMLDGFPHLGFKAYLSARQRDDTFPSRENLYAPFYLWKQADGLNNFLTSPGFAGLTRDLGWPVVKTWFVWEAAVANDLSGACFASREIETIAPHSDLAVHRAAASAKANAARNEGALAAVAAFDPTGWTCVHFRLWPAAPATIGQDAQVYSVGHLSLP